MNSEFNRFNLDQAIAEWRRQMTAGGVGSPVLLDELEGHVLEDIAGLVSAGEPEARAFQLAVSRVGSPVSLRTEFRKVEPATFQPVRIGSWFWLVAVAVMAVFLFRGMITGKLSLLLSAHIFSLTAGYGAALLAGGFGICYVVCRSFRALSPFREQALGRAAFRFTRVAAVLVVAGLVLGMLWTGQNRGRYLTGDPREIGTLCAAFWLTGLCLMRRANRIGHRAVMLACVAGNAIIGVAWFGAGVLAHGGGIASYWLLDVLVLAHLLFFVMGALPTTEPVET